MVAFLWLVGVFVSFVALAYFDVKGNAFFNMKPRAEIYDAEFRLMFGGLACAMWPLALGLLIIVLFYRGLIAIFSRQPKKPKVWSCPMIKPSAGYRDPIERCSVKAKSVKPPKCGKHHCEMVEEK